MSKTTWVVGIAVLAGVVSLIFLRNASPEAPIKIGVLLPLTGGLATYGEPAQKITALAIEDINREGGVHGRRLEANYQDHQCNPKIAVSILEQLTASENIRVFASAACSGTVLSIAPLLEPHQAILVGTNVTTPKITGVSPFVFRNWATDATESKLFAEKILEEKLIRIGALYEETDYARGLVLSLESFLKGSAVEIRSESFTSGATDVRSQLLKLKAQNPEVLFISPQTVPSAHIILRQMRELGVKPQRLFVNDNILRSPELLTTYSDLLEGAFSADYALPQSDASKTVLARYAARYGAECTQTNLCLAMYDAIRLLARGMQTTTTTQELKVYLEETSYEGISGRVSFDAQHDRNNAAYSLFAITGGKAQPVR